MAKQRKYTGSVDYVSRLIFLIMFFLIGAVLGSFFAANISDKALSYVENYVFQANKQISFSSVWKYLAIDLTLILLPFLSGFSRIGVIISPLFIGIKGFMLSMTVTSFVNALGLKGYVSAFAVVFVYGAVTLAAMLLTAMQSLGLSITKWRVRRGYTDKAYFISGVVCIFISMAASAIYVYISPMINVTVTTFLFN